MKDKFIFEESDDPLMYDDQYILKSDKNITIQLNDNYIHVNKWVEEEEAMYHLGSFKCLREAMEQAFILGEKQL